MKGYCTKDNYRDWMDPCVEATGNIATYTSKYAVMAISKLNNPDKYVEIPTNCRSNLNIGGSWVTM